MKKAATFDDLMSKAATLLVLAARERNADDITISAHVNSGRAEFHLYYSEREVEGSVPARSVKADAK